MIADELRIRAVAAPGTLIIRALGATLRFEREGVEHFRRLESEGRPWIFLVWHCTLLPLVYLHRGEGVTTLASRHRDGELVAQMLQSFGFGVARGSSTRGGARGMRELLRVVRSGGVLALTPDGPVGPARRLKAGPLVIAQLAGVPIVPVAIGGSRVWRLGSWDRFMVPKPFARLKVSYGAPVEIPRDSTATEFERARTELEERLNRMMDAVGGTDAEDPP